MSSTNNHKNDDSSVHLKTILEGSATMKFPSHENEKVFYNPVQVQNRDLSILMIALFAERRLIRNSTTKYKKQLNKETNLSRDEKQIKLKEYEASLNGTLLVKDKQHDGERGITILDALAASGLRSIRYWKEIPGVHNVTINDMDPLAIERAHNNVKTNGLQEFILDKEQQQQDGSRQHGITIQQGDATHEMYMSRRPPNLQQPKPHQLLQKDQYDVIDLDPYGSAAPFLDSAIQAVANHGMLCVTCTDMAALGGSHPETAFGRYHGSIPIPHVKYLQEVALRILLYTMSTTAAKYGRTIHPILSVGMAFYVRVFVEVRNDKAGVNELSTKIGQVYQSTQCPSFHVVPHGKRKGNVYQPSRVVPSTCQETGAPFKVGGPLWLGPLHDLHVVQTALERLDEKSSTADVVPNMEYIATRKRIHGLLTSVSEELNHVPLYYTLPDLCKTLRIPSPPMDNIKAAIMNCGYQVSGYHKEPQAIKTDAPNSVIWDVMRSWYKKRTVKEDGEEKSKKKKNKTNEAAQKILSVEPTMSVDFTVPTSLSENKKKATRFPLNPERNWGPKPASGMFSKKRKKSQDDVESSSSSKSKQQDVEE